VEAPDPTPIYNEDPVLRVIGDSIAVELDAQSVREKTDSGIYIPEAAREESESQMGRVYCTGLGMRNVINGDHCGVDVQEGDTVIIPANTGFPIEVDGRKFLVIKEGDIIAFM